MNASFVNEDFNDCSAVKKSQTFKISQLENSVSLSVSHMSSVKKKKQVKKLT